ncbi:MAG: iron ABC transporter ATP-binding protein [Rheinheimera sp.]|uniref:ABC transporter ATP-binding protein n=1 Tax=Arsukibacterium sp. UBA3155 TaxID=1946058 RepID=UPI000C8DBAE1|nr:ABC transporter ATP-binding protein [Arsukibacterium sp. UBA3155]MAD75764.1 iron ABC transporter ATP-binding protein [Rheinheimera sp.]|tara:strand:- start:58655 stop:59692 length:1038 start_codon:yes stop_codon:yes gene_type:complete
MLVLDTLAVAYGSHVVVKDVSLALAEGQIGCLVGPSGCGKTTLLRAIAGFEPAASGSISLQQRLVSDQQTQLATELRRVGMVFQDFALFPHLSVADNISFGLQGTSSTFKQDKVKQLLQLVGLPDLANRYPHQLSGGQQQRVALARALAPEPKVLLLDEPFSSLDAELREALARDIRQILQQLKITAVMVTHDQFEAFTMADMVGVMQHGKLQQWATPYELYHKPASRFVADFVGRGVMLPGEMLDARRVQTCLGIFNQRYLQNANTGDKVDVLIRPDDIVHDDASGITAKVLEKSFRGSHILYTLALSGGEQVYCLALSHHNHAIGEQIGIRLDLDHLVLFPRI